MTTQRTAPPMFAVMLAAALLPLQASAVPYTALDIGATGQRTAAGYTAVSGFADGVNGQNLSATTVTSITGDQFTIAISNLNAAGSAVGGIDWRDRGNGTGGDSLVPLGEDHIKNNTGIIRVTLASLPAGTYNAVSFHRDADNAQSGAIQVRVDTGAGFGAVLATGNANSSVGGVNGLTNVNVNGTSASFSFVADGTNDVVLLFDGTAAADIEVPLSGFTLDFTPVPEPSSIIGVAVLGLAGLGFLRRRTAA